MRLFLLLVLCTTPALAQEAEPTETRTRFYNFEELNLTGKKLKPKVLYSDAKQRAKFEKLFALKRSFMPELRRTADGATVVKAGQ